MKRFIQIISDKCFIPFVVTLYIGVIAFSYKYEMNPYLWFDEAGQFWISKGLNHDSDPLSNGGTLRDVIINNHDYNLDPGGFSILLYFWSKMGNGYIWLRTLPFLFFLATIVGFCYLGYYWTKNKYVAMIIGFVPIVIKMLFYEAFELRAYSMEVLGCVVSVIAIVDIQKNVSFKTLIKWSFIIAFFMTSRYSFIIVAFSASLYVLWLIYKSTNTNKKKVLMMATYSIPLFAVLAYNYCFAMRFQNPDLSSLSYLPYLNTDWKRLIYITSARHFFYIALICWLIYLLNGSRIIKKYYGLITVTFITNLLFILLSFLGMHPWDPDNTRCISMVTLVIISISALWCELMNILFKYNGAKYMILLFVCLMLYGYKQDRKKGYDNTLADISILTSLKGKVYVDRWESPCIRYLFEYGVLQQQANYPEDFTFIKMRKHGFNTSISGDRIPLQKWYETTQPNMNQLMEYDILITPELYRYKPDNSDNWVGVNNHNKVFVRSTQ